MKKIKFALGAPVAMSIAIGGTALIAVLIPSVGLVSVLARPLTLALDLAMAGMLVYLVQRHLGKCQKAKEEQARLAAEILRQKELLAVTLASIGDGVIVTDIRGQVTFLNAEAERLTGRTNRETEGYPLPAVFHVIDEQTRQPLEDPVEKVRGLGTVVGLVNHTMLIAKDGREIPIDGSAAADPPERRHGCGSGDGISRLHRA